MKKETNAVDDFFRKSLQDYKPTPPEISRSRFLEEATSQTGPGRGKFFRWYTLLTVAVVITASIILYNRLSHHQAPVFTKEASRSSNKTTKAADPESRIVTTIEVPVTKTNENKTLYANEIKIQKNNKHKQSSTTVENEKSIVSVKIASKAEKPEGDIQEKLIAQPEQMQVVTDTNMILSPTREAEPSQIGEIPVTEQDFDAKSNNASTPKNDYPEPLPPVDETPAHPAKRSFFSELAFSPCFYYSFDWQDNADGNSLVHALGTEGKIQYRRFSLYSGIAVTASNGLRGYQVQYNDYLGNYQKLDSITFAWDQKQYYLVPTYYMSDTKVWDSVVKHDSYQEENRYNQLRIPVMLGYDIISRDKFAIGLKTGVEMMFHLKTRTVTVYEYSAGQNKLLSVNPMEDNLARNSYWLMANLSAIYYLNRRIFFELEPRLQYLLNPADSESGKGIKPAVRASVKIKF